jgi:hypothetical protein
MDRDLLDLRRRVLEEGADATARYRYRVECLRAGRPDLAGLEVGDVVLVDEVESPWVRGSWRGEVLRLFDAGDKYVRPLDPGVSYRVKPSPEYLAKGLYLTREDRTSLVRPALPLDPSRERRAA